MDQTRVPQSSSGECSQARHSSWESTSSSTDESCQANEPTRSNHEQKFDVFLSHSGKQKIPARQLYRDLTNQADNEKWKQLEKSGEKRAEWHQALNAIRRINGLTFNEVGDVAEFSEQIVKEIWHILPAPSARYHVPHMQGEVRMCQEVAHFFDRVQLNERGIRIAGLYGIAGQGKTTLGKAFCNYKLGDFEGKVCHLEFSRGDSVERIKLALQYLTHRPQSHLQTLTIQDEAQNELYTRLRGHRGKGQKALLVLDNITEESIDEVTYYLRADFGENSCILLSARSVDVLTKHFNIDSQSCMRVPRLEEEEAIAILVKRAFPGESKLGAEDRDFALKCANRCSFKETNGDIYPRARTFHPLALKAFGRYLLGKNGSNLSKWVAEIDCTVDGYGDGLVEVFSVLHKAFSCMHPKYRTIFMLLTVYMLPNMTPGKVKEWLAINCNEEISFIEKAVENLCKKAFIEEFEPEIRIHDLYVEFAQSKANEMERWLWWKKKDDQCSRRGLIAQDSAGFELAKLQQCRYRTIAPDYLRNLLVLQLVDVHNLIKLDLGQMNKLRSITLRDCKALATVDGLPNLLDLAWLQIGGVNPMFRLPELSSIEGLQHLEIDIADSQVLDQLGDLTNCFCLREINVRCPSLSEFPRLSGMPHLEKVEFSLCETVQGILDCTECVELQSIVLNRCCQMSSSPLLAGCKKLSKIVLSECDAVTACTDMCVPSSLKTLELFISPEAASVPRDLESCYELENLQLWNMGELKKLPSFRSFSNLTVLKLGKCGIRQPPNLTCCVMLENVYFFTLKNLESFPNFSLLRKLKTLSLYNCRRVQDPPDISGCHQLQVLHLLYSDNMKGLPKMDECAQLDEIKVSWHGEDEVTYDGIDPDSCEVDDDFQSCLEHFEDEIPVENLNDVFVPEELRGWQRMQEQRWMQRRTMLAKKYFRGVKMYYSITTPYEAYKSSKLYKPNYITLRLINSQVLALPTLGRVSKDRDWLNKDRDWLKKVREYFAGKKVSVRTCAASGKVLMPALNDLLV
ncbi:hypothetical protein SUGI_0874330 [Cryptomeria japonica]|nr:hypothetical protein SUGI_0874330 [Cryptomeria japonica]